MSYHSRKVRLVSQLGVKGGRRKEEREGKGGQKEGGAEEVFFLGWSELVLVSRPMSKRERRAADEIIVVLGEDQASTALLGLRSRM